MEKKWIVVCAGNRGRSPLTTAMLKEAFASEGLAIEVDQAGFMDLAAEGKPIHPNIHLVPWAARFDFSNHRSTWLNALDLSQYDKIVCIDHEVASAVRARGGNEEQIITLLIPDPIHGDPTVEWPKCGNAIEAAVKELVKQAKEV